MIPRIIHKTSNTKTWEEDHVDARAKKMMPNFAHIFWDDEANLELVKSVFPNYVDVFLGIKRGVVRADIARCLFLYTKGGVYCDTDYLFYRPLNADFLSHKCVLGVEEIENSEVGGGYKVGNAFMASEAKFELWYKFVESIFEEISPRTSDPRTEMGVLLLSGPHALSIFLKKNKQYESQVTFLPTKTVYPSLKWRGLSAVRDKSTIGVHLCWGRWRDLPLIEQIKQRIRRWGSAIL